MFTTPCFIRKNTPELRQRLEKLGYVDNSLYRENETNLYVGGYIYTSADFIDPYYYDCGTNEELFLALAALRDDSDYMQWFTDGEKWFQNKQNDIEVIHYGAGNPINFHNATAEEIIEYFNGKQYGK